MRALVVLLALAAAAGARGSGDPRLLWELKLPASAAEPARAADDVLALRYSPDGKWIAAIVSSLTGEGDRSEVMLVPASGAAPGVRHLRVEGGIRGTAERPGIHWSPASDVLAVETKRFTAAIFRLEGGTHCELPRTSVFGGFLGDGLVVAADWEPPKDPASIPLDSSSLTVYGADCRAQQTWKVRGHVRDLELSAAAGLIALGPEDAEIRVLRRASELEVAHVPERTGSMLRFGENGAVLCKADRDPRGALACYELATGKRFVNPQISGGAPFDVSLSGSIVLASDGSYGVEALSGSEHRGVRAWVVWDYRTGSTLGRIRYRGQRHGYAVSPVAMAPDGSRFAVAARGAIRVYEVAR
jgi:hypothetical protein